MEWQVASLLREHEGSKTEAGLRVGDLHQRLNEAQVLLSRERDAFAERKVRSHKQGLLWFSPTPARVRKCFLAVVRSGGDDDEASFSLSFSSLWRDLCVQIVLLSEANRAVAPPA